MAQAVTMLRCTEPNCPTPDKEFKGPGALKRHLVAIHGRPPKYPKKPGVDGVRPPGGKPGDDLFDISISLSPDGGLNIRVWDRTFYEAEKFMKFANKIAAIQAWVNQFHGKAFGKPGGQS